MNSDGQKGQDRMFVSNGSLTSSLPSEQHREGTKIFDVTMINESRSRLKKGLIISHNSVIHNILRENDFYALVAKLLFLQND